MPRTFEILSCRIHSVLAVILSKSLSVHFNEPTCCPFQCGGSVVDSLFNVPHVGLRGFSVFGPCYVMHQLLSFLVLQSS